MNFFFFFQSYINFNYSHGLRRITTRLSVKSFSTNASIRWCLKKKTGDLSSKHTRENRRTGHFRLNSRTRRIFVCFSFFFQIPSNTCVRSANISPEVIISRTRCGVFRMSAKSHCVSLRSIDIYPIFL